MLTLPNPAGPRVWLPGAESLERLECCRLVCEVVECPCCCLDLGDGRVASLNAEAREPAQRRALEALRFRAPNRDGRLRGISEVHAWQLGGGVADEVRFSVFSARRKRAYVDP